MTYVLLMTFFLKGGMTETRHTTVQTKEECSLYEYLVVRDEMLKNKDWHVQWIDVQCVKVQRGKTV